jgi:hypothetical protein
MSITVFWDNEQKTVIRQVYGSTWKWDEYLAAFKQLDQLASEVTHQISVIADVSQTRRIPPNAITYGSRAIRGLPTNVAFAVVVTPSPLILSLLKVILVLARFDNLYIAATEAEAQALIEAKKDDLRLQHE